MIKCKIKKNFNSIEYYFTFTNDFMIIELDNCIYPWKWFKVHCSIKYNVGVQSTRNCLIISVETKMCCGMLEKSSTWHKKLKKFY